MAPETTSTTLPTPQSKNLLSISAITIALLAFALSYLGYQNWQLQQQVNRLENLIQVDNTPYNPSSPSPTPDLTADWKTYTNSKYKFSFRYPSAWEQSEREDNNENMLVLDHSGEGFYDSNQYQANNLLVRVLPATKQPGGQVCFPRKTAPECYLLSQAQITTVNNIPSYLIDYFIPMEGATSKTDKVRLILVENSGYIYSISQQRIISKEAEFLSVFNLILSTFKFLD